MAVSREFLRRAADDTGFPIAALEKVARLGELAGDIAKHPLLKDALALKGGTPLNLCFAPPQRMSVDLDYNYIHHLDREAMREERPSIEQAIVELVRRRGYVAGTPTDEHAGRTFSLQYRSVDGPADLIKLDINYQMRLPLADIQTLSLWQPGGLDHVNVSVVSTLELLVGKVLAFFDRAAARDAWDVANLPASIASTLERTDFRQTFLALAGMLIHPPSVESEARIRRLITPEVVSQQLVPMLVGGAGVDPTELVDRAWQRVSGLVELSAGEAKYFEQINAGTLDLALLFPDDPREATRLAGHPALLWKILNVQKHKKNR